MNKLYCIPSLERLGDYIAFSERYRAGFEYNDFFIPDLLDDETALQRVIKKYLDTGRDCSKDTLHGAFFDVCINSSDSKIFAVSDLRIRQSMDIARKMGLCAVIFHTNYIVNFRLRYYLNTWLDRNEEYWRKLLRDYPEQKIFIENMFDDSPQLLAELAKRMADEERFAVCLDTAHALIWEARWNHGLRSLNRMWGMFILMIMMERKIYIAVGEGCFPWETFDQWIRSFHYKPSVLVEVRSTEGLQRSVEYMKAHNIYPL